MITEQEPLFLVTDTGFQGDYTHTAWRFCHCLYVRVYVCAHMYVSGTLVLVLQSHPISCVHVPGSWKAEMLHVQPA